MINNYDLTVNILLGIFEFSYILFKNIRMNIFI